MPPSPPRCPHSMISARSADAFLGAKPRDLFFREASFRKHLVGMGAKLRRCMAQTRRRVRELYWKPYHAHEAALPLVDFDHHLLRLHLVILEHLGDREHLAAR